MSEMSYNAYKIQQSKLIQAEEVRENSRRYHGKAKKLYLEIIDLMRENQVHKNKLEIVHSRQVVEWVHWLTRRAMRHLKKSHDDIRYMSQLKREEKLQSRKENLKKNVKK